MIRGRIVLNREQSDNLADGRKLYLERKQFMHFLRKDPQIGDLIWVQEPYTEFVPGRYVHKTVLSQIVPGYLLTAKTPNEFRGIEHKRYMRLDGSRMPRACSRATLVVEWIAPARTHIRCKVVFKQIDEFEVDGVKG